MDSIRYSMMNLIGSACKMSSFYLVMTNLIFHQQEIQQGNFKRTAGALGLSIALYSVGKLFHDFSTAYFHQLDNNFEGLEKKLENNNKLLKKLKK